MTESRHQGVDSGAAHPIEGVSHGHLRRPSRPAREPGGLRQLEEKILERDQQGASQIYYDLVRAGRPLPELLGQIVRIHAPYTHVPYHQRLDNGIVRFVNNDHCLLSSRASTDLM